MAYVFPPPASVVLAIEGSNDYFPVHRIYCVGKNYADHIREMGAELGPDAAREEPCFFLKPTDSIVTGTKLPYPSATQNFHYEGELVIALGRGGRDIPETDALTHVYGYALGLDMTRRDLQIQAARKGLPWDTGKSFEHASPVSAITPVASCGHLEQGAICLWVNDTLKQNANLNDLLWKPKEIISALSRLYTLQPGDLIFTGTPAGVGAVTPGDQLKLTIAELGCLELTVTK